MLRYLLICLMLFTGSAHTADDYFDAVKKAAEQGQVNAQYNLGFMYARWRRRARGYMSRPRAGTARPQNREMPMRRTMLCLMYAYWRWRARGRHTSLRLDQSCFCTRRGECQKSKRTSYWRNDPRRDCRGAETFTQILGSLRSRPQYTIGIIRLSTGKRTPHALPATRLHRPAEGLPGLGNRVVGCPASTVILADQLFPAADRSAGTPWAARVAQDARYGQTVPYRRSRGGDLAGGLEVLKDGFDMKDSIRSGD